jgi:hypothetical protein
MGPRKLGTACTVRAVTRCGWERRAGPVDTTSWRVGGEYQCAEAQDLPCRVTSGASQETRPDLKPCGRSPLGVERAVPLWGTPEEGKASDTTLQTTRFSEMA